MARPYEPEYYFEHTAEFPLPELFEGARDAGEVLLRAKAFCAGLAGRLAECGGQQVLGECRENVVLRGPVYIGRGTVVQPGAVVQGPVYIGENCEIAAGALLRPNTVLGNGCSVGHGSEVKAAVLQNGSKVASLAFVGDSVLGRSARVGSGCILANRKFNQSNVGVKIDGEYHDLGRDFFGCVLGDSSRLGANCTTLPGTHIGSYSWVLPGCVVKGFVPGGTRVSKAQELRFEENPRVELK